MSNNLDDNFASSIDKWSQESLQPASKGLWKAPGIRAKIEHPEGSFTGLQILVGNIMENQFKPEPLKNLLFFPVSTHLLSISTTRNTVFSTCFSCLVFRSGFVISFPASSASSSSSSSTAVDIHIPMCGPYGHWFSRFRDQDEVCTGPEREATPKLGMRSCLHGDVGQGLVLWV